MRRAKTEGEASRDLLELRLTGYGCVKNATYKFLRSTYEAGVEITVHLKPSESGQKVYYQGRILLFDRGSNLLLSDVRVHPGEGPLLPFVYIR